MVRGRLLSAPPPPSSPASPLPGRGPRRPRQRARAIRRSQPRTHGRSSATTRRLTCSFTPPLIAAGGPIGGATARSLRSRRRRSPDSSSSCPPRHPPPRRTASPWTSSNPAGCPGADAFTDTGLCAFPVEVTVSQTAEYQPFFAKDGSGQLTRETDHVLTSATIVNPATGRSFTDGGQTSDRATYLPDGSVEIRTTGILHNALVDTGQLLFHQAGYHSVLIGADGQLLSQVFHGNFFDSGSEFAAEVCPILAQPA